MLYTPMYKAPLTRNYAMLSLSTVVSQMFKSIGKWTVRQQLPTDTCISVHLCLHQHLKCLWSFWC